MASFRRLTHPHSLNKLTLPLKYLKKYDAVPDIQVRHIMYYLISSLNNQGHTKGSSKMLNTSSSGTRYSGKKFRDWKPFCTRCTCSSRSFSTGEGQSNSGEFKDKKTTETDSLTKNVQKLDFKFPDPDLDWAYILDGMNKKEIMENIRRRKGVGDIEKVRNLWNQLSFPEEVEVEHMDGLTKIKGQLLSEAIALPNFTHPEVPIGDESQNRLVEMVGIRKEFDFEPQSVVKIGEDLGMLRTENLGHTTGPKTYYLLDGFAQLEQALVRYSVDFLEKAGFSLVSVPDLIHPDVVERCGFRTSGDRTQVYKLDPLKHGNIALAGTGEMPLAGLLMGQKFSLEDLPKRLMTVSRCFRAETSDLEEEKGIYRVHQFTKVEMFGVTSQTTGTESEKLLQEFVDIQKTLFSKLGLHFRILDMASEELGAPAYRKYDIETWMPAKEFWGEISSASNCTDFQSRRLGIKYQEKDKISHVHTINGTACAVPRMIMALVENSQNKDGTVSVPEALHEYMDGTKILKRSSNAVNMKWIKLTKSYKSRTKSSSGQSDQ